jgi:hypothetical protein
MSNKKIDPYQIAFRVIPVLINSKYKIKDSYRYADYIQEGTSQDIDDSNMDLTQAREVIDFIKKQSNK